MNFWNYLKRVLGNERGVLPLAAAGSSGLLAGSGAGATAATPFLSTAAGKAALIGAGSKGVGSIVSGIGAGLSAASQAEKDEAEERRKERELAILEAQVQQQQVQAERGQGLQGIGLLAQLRQQAQEQFARQPFKDALFRR